MEDHMEVSDDADDMVEIGVHDKLKGIEVIWNKQ